MFNSVCLCSCFVLFVAVVCFVFAMFLCHCCILPLPDCLIILFLYNLQYHCWKCGEVFCIRCIDKQTFLPGHFYERPVAVCRPCYRELKLGSSDPVPQSPTSHASSPSPGSMFEPRLDNLINEIHE